MNRPVLLDTCAVIWLMNGDNISADSRAAIRAVQAEHLGVYVSPFTAWEIATLAARGRLQLTLSPEAWFDGLLSLPGVRLVTLSPKILMASAMLPGTPPRDPADRILAAAARAFGYSVVTRNGQLTLYGAAGHIEIIGC